MDDNNPSSGSLYESTSSSEEDDDLDEIFIAHVMNVRKYFYVRHLKGHQC